MNEQKQPEPLRLADLLTTRNNSPAGFGLGPVCDDAAAELRRLHAENERLRLHASGADTLVEVWKGRAQDFMNSRDRLLKANRSLWAKLDSLRAGLGQPVAWIHTDPNNARVRILDWNPDGRGFRGHWIKTPLHVGQPPQQPTARGPWIYEYPGDVFVVFDPMTDGAGIVGAARTLREAGAILEAVGQEPPKDKNSSVVFTAPQGWGKTRDAKHLLKLFGLNRLVDDWTPGMPVQDRTLHLTNVPPEELERLQLQCRVIAKGWPARAVPPKDEPAPGEVR